MSVFQSIAPAAETQLSEDQQTDDNQPPETEDQPPETEDQPAEAANEAQAEDAADDGQPDDDSGKDADEGSQDESGEGSQPSSENDEMQGPKWAKDLRRDWVQARRENKRLQYELETLRANQQPKTTQIDPGKEPELHDPDIDWDTDKFKAKLNEWHLKSREAEIRKAQQQAQQPLPMA